MRIFLDTEFVDDGFTIDLISIGLVAEDGGELYMENGECDLSKASPWVKENVIPHLTGGLRAFPRDRIAEMVRRFAGKEPEFWAWYGAYDFVTLMQLYGPAIERPGNWPLYYHELKVLSDMLGNPKLPKQGEAEHRAINDARWNKEVFEFLQRMVNRDSRIMLP